MVPLAFLPDVTHKIPLAARYASCFSTFKNVNTLAPSHIKDIIKFMSSDYLDILIQYSLHIIPIGWLPIDLVSSTDTDTSGSASWTDDSDSEAKHKRISGTVGIWTRMIESLHLFGFDQILALSHTSVCSHFHNLHKRGGKSVLLTWSLDQFSANFNPITVQFLSNGKAIVFITITSGELPVEKYVHSIYYLARMNINNYHVLGRLKPLSSGGFLSISTLLAVKMQKLSGLMRLL